MDPGDVAIRIDALIDRGLERYGRGDLRAALSEWEHALMLQAGEPRATEYIAYVRENFSLLEETFRDARQEAERAFARAHGNPGEIEEALASGARAAPEGPGRAWGGGLDELAAGWIPDEEPPPRTAVKVITGASSILRADDEASAHAPTEPDGYPASGLPDAQADAFPEIVLEAGATGTKAFAAETFDGPDPPTMLVRGGNVPPVDLPIELTLPSPQDLAEPPDDVATGWTAADEVRARIERLLADAYEALEAGDLDIAVAAVEVAELQDASDGGGRETLEIYKDLRAAVYRAAVGPADRVPVLNVPVSSLGSYRIDHRAGFLLSRIDGTLTLDEVIDVSGMPSLEVYGLLARLFRRGIIA